MKKFNNDNNGGFIFLSTSWYIDIIRAVELLIFWSVDFVVLVVTSAVGVVLDGFARVFVVALGHGELDDEGVFPGSANVRD